jgi:hypothetical protein
VFTKVVRPVPEAPKSSKDIEQLDRNVDKRGLTDDHDRELDTLFDLISSASSGERHSDKTWYERDAGDELAVHGQLKPIQAPTE